MLQREMARRVRLMVLAVELLALSVVCLVMFLLAVTGGALLVVWVGLALLLVVVAATRRLAGLARRTAGAVLGDPIESPYLAPRQGNLFDRLRGYARDPATWRDALWLFANGTLGLALTITAVVESVLDLLLWWLPPGQFARLDALLTRALLAPNEKTRLAQRVDELAESRAETVDSSAAELRRIERDLHDGAQARLVALGMNLGLAEEQLHSDPAAAQRLLAEARETSTQALAELRDLVRGIHPPVLADRGLVGAVQALALAAPMPVTVHADVPERLPQPVESAAYFAVAEALANAIKHSSATAVEISLSCPGELLDVVVRDNGIGGADPSAGSGLRGIQRRLSAFDGKLVVTSPPGGPTELIVELPCASSSPKTSPSSGTG